MLSPGGGGGGVIRCLCLPLQVDGFFTLLFGLGSINTLTAISITRYIKGCHPSKGEQGGWQAWPKPGIKAALTETLLGSGRHAGQTLSSVISSSADVSVVLGN